MLLSQSSKQKAEPGRNADRQAAMQPGHKNRGRGKKGQNGHVEKESDGPTLRPLGVFLGL